MAYDEDLAERIRGSLGDVETVEKKMFGGLAFLVGGHMAVAAGGKGGLMVRCAPDQTDALVAEGAEQMVMRGRAMRGWLSLTGEQVASDRDLDLWVAVGVDYTSSLDPK